MAAIVEFEGLGENLLTGLKQATDATIKLRDEVTKSNEAIKKGATEGAAAEQKLAATIDETAEGLRAVRKEAAGGIDKGIKDASRSAKDLNTSLSVTAEDLVKATFAADLLAKQQREIRSEAQRVTAEVAKGKVSQEQGLAVVQKLAKEYANNAAQMEELAQAAKQVSVGFKGTEAPAKSLRTQIKEAKIELDTLIEASDGKITPELIAAAKKAGELQDRFGDLNATVEAFNPDTKFKAVLGVFGNVAGGIQAATSALGLFGAESDDVNKALLKVQQASAFFQGLQSFVGGLADNWKNLRTIIAASAVTTQADTTAKAANAAGTATLATANTAAAGATGALTTAFNAMKAALLSNPITAIAVALLALGAAFASAIRDTRDYTASLDDLITRLDAVSKSRFNEIDQRLRLEGIANEREALEAGETEAAKRRQKEREYLSERSALVAKQLERELNLRTLISEIQSLEGRDSDSANQARETALAKLREYTEEFKQGTIDLKVLELEQTNTTIAENNQRTKSNQDAARARVKAAEAAAADIARIEAELKSRLDSLTLENADPRQRLELEREAAIESVRILQRTLQEKIALQRLEAEVGTETFAQLSEAQKKARTDALIDGGQVELAAEQQEQVTGIEIQIWEKYWKDRKDIAITEQQALLDLQTDGSEKERAAFELDLDARVDKLRENGATVLQIEEFIAAQRQKFSTDQVAKAIDIEEQIALARIEGIRQGDESERVFRFRIESEKLALQEEFARRRLANISDDGTQETALLKAQLEAALVAIENARGELEATRPKQDLFDLLGLNLSDEAKQQAIAGLQSIANTVRDFVQSSIAQQQEALDAEIAINDDRIAEQQRLRDELQGQLEAALEDERNGYAANSDGIRAQIELTKKAEADALAEKKRLQAEASKLARQQILIDSAVQVSSLITAGANLFAAGSKLGPAGIISAIALAASLVATFASIKAKMKAAAVPQGFHKGTKYVELGANPRGRDTITARLDEGEAVVSAKNNKRYAHLVEGIVEGDLHKVQQAAIKELLGANIQLEPERITRIVQAKERYIVEKESGATEDVKALRKDVKRLTGVVESFMEQEQKRPRPTGKEVSTPTRKVTAR